MQYDMPNATKGKNADNYTQTLLKTRIIESFIPYKKK